MNLSQINSIVRTLLKIIGTALVTHGATNAGNIVNSEDIIGLVLTIVGLIWSHYAHTPEPVPSSQGNLFKLALLFLLPAFLLTGCTATQQRVSYNTLFSVEHSVSAAVDAYDGAVISGSVPTNAVPLVSRAFNQFQASMLIALDAVQFNTNAIAPPALAVEAQDLIHLITTIKEVK